jgi:hypothetical protein
MEGWFLPQQRRKIKAKHRPALPVREKLEKTAKGA